MSKVSLTARYMETNPPNPYPEEPEVVYYKQDWDARGVPSVEVRRGITFFTPTAGMHFTIYGWIRRSADLEDDKIEKQIFQKGGRSVVAFSIVVPDGELGVVLRKDLTPITEDEFKQAEAAGWL